LVLSQRESRCEIKQNQPGPRVYQLSYSIDMLTLLGNLYHPHARQDRRGPLTLLREAVLFSVDRDAKLRQNALNFRKGNSFPANSHVFSVI
jgi:hypothetical protein